MDVRCSWAFDSVIGRLRVTATPSHLVEVKLSAPDLGDGHLEGAAGRMCRRAEEQIQAYLAGDLVEFTVPYRVVGTRFQRSVLRAMARIPYGLTATYGDLARQVGEPGGSRAVGAVCGANPLPIVVPCHRVLAKEGLGGFGGGLAMKRWLLELEVRGRPPRSELAEGPRPAAVAGEQQSLF